MDTTAPADPVKRAKAAAEARIALVSTAAKRAEKIAALTAKLQEEYGFYGKEYQAALTAWSKDDLEGFGLIAPDHPSLIGPPRRAARKQNT